MSERDALVAALATAANTDDVIRWDALRQKMAAAPPGLTERDRCQLLLTAANGETLTGRQWNQLVGAVVLSGADKRAIALTERDRAGVIANLRVIVTGSERERAETAEQLAGIASQLVILVPSWKSGSRVDRIVACSMRGAIAMGLWLFADASRPFGADLCQCGHKECGQFFFRRRPRGRRGAPIRRYCSAAHAKAADTAAAAQRMARLRKGSQ